MVKKTTLGYLKNFVTDMLHESVVPRFQRYTGDGFSLRRSRSFGVETVWFEYRGRGLSVEIEGEEGTDGGVLINFDRTPALKVLDDAIKEQLAADLRGAMQSAQIPCQVIEGNRVL